MSRKMVSISLDHIDYHNPEATQEDMRSLCGTHPFVKSTAGGVMFKGNWFIVHRFWKVDGNPSRIPRLEE